jgi:hypothetical protein
MADTAHRFAWSYGFEGYDLRCRITERGVGVYTVTVMENFTELEHREITAVGPDAFERVWEEATMMQTRYYPRARREWRQQRDRERFE